MCERGERGRRERYVCRYVFQDEEGNLGLSCGETACVVAKGRRKKKEKKAGVEN